MDLPTVCIVNEKAKSGFTRINQADFDPEVHELYDEEAGGPVEAKPVALTIAKGAKGLWFVKRGKVNVAGGFASEGEAKDELAKIEAGA